MTQELILRSEEGWLKNGNVSGTNFFPGILVSEAILLSPTHDPLLSQSMNSVRIQAACLICHENINAINVECLSKQSKKHEAAKEKPLKRRLLSSPCILA